jgi:hypothetical protein
VCPEARLTVRTPARVIVDSARLWVAVGMQPPTRRRRALAITLIAVASTAAVLAIFSLWVNRQLLDTESWATTSSTLLERPVIRDRISGFLVDELYENVDVAGELQTALPDRAKLLAGPAAGALRPLAERATEELLSRPRGQQAWEAANRTAHILLLKVLAGGGANVSTENGVVTLDLKQLLEETEARLGVGGRLAGRLPERAAQITVLRSDQLAGAQDAFQALKALPIVLVGVSLALFGIALWITPGWRRKAVRAYGIGYIAGGAGALAVASVVGDTVVDSLARTAAAAPAVDETWTIATTLLREAATATIFYGVVMVGGAALAGPSLTATALRRTAAPVLRAPAVAYGALAVVLAIVVVWWAPTPAARNPALAVLLCALIAAGFEGLRRQTAREFPEADFGATQRRTREQLAAAADAVRRRTKAGADRAVRQTGAVRATRSGNGAAAPAPEEDRLVRLERLGRLRDSGALDDEEFRAEKARIMASGIGAG